MRLMCLCVHRNMNVIIPPHPTPPHVLFLSQYLSGTMHESRAHIYAPYEGSRGIDIHPVDYQARQCKTSADRGEDALADLEVDAKAPLQVVAEQ